jgi:hypothetical protein
MSPTGPVTKNDRAVDDQQQFTPPADGNWLRSPRTRLKHGAELYLCLKWVFISFTCLSIFRYCILLNRAISLSNHFHI